ncbi:MAG: hypothetical protein R3F43_01420 [bacterium]
MRASIAGDLCSPASKRSRTTRWATPFSASVRWAIHEGGEHRITGTEA